MSQNQTPFDPNQAGNFILIGTPFGSCAVHMSQKRSLVEIEEAIMRPSFPSTRYSEVSIFDLKPSTSNDGILPGQGLRCLRRLHSPDFEGVIINRLINNARLEGDRRGLEDRIIMLTRALNTIKAELDYITKGGVEENNTMDLE